MTTFSSSLKQNDLQLWRYVKRSTKEDPGWAILVLGSDGYFSACSDYGNYAFIWGSPGVNDFRKFFLSADKDPSYFIGKLSHGQQFDGEGTEAMYKEEILRMRREGEMSRETARKEWNLLSDIGFSHVVEFSEWLDRTTMKWAWEWGYKQRHSRDVHAFVELVLGRWLVPVLKAELATT